MNVEITWATAGEVLTVMVILSGIAFMVLKSRFAGDFVTRNEHARMAQRLDAIESKIAAMPTHNDITALGTRVSQVAQEVAVAGAAIEGMRASVGRIENMVDMLMQAQLDREKVR